jgi:hypothetical protein
LKRVPARARPRAGRACPGLHAVQARAFSPGRPLPETPGSFPRDTRRSAIRAIPRPGARYVVQRSVCGSPPPCAVPRRHLRRHPFITSERAPNLKVVRPPSRVPCQCHPQWPPPKQTLVPELFRRRPTPPIPSLPHTRSLASAYRPAPPPPRRSRGHRGGGRRCLSSASTVASCPSAPTPSTNRPRVILPTSLHPSPAGNAAGSLGIGQSRRLPMAKGRIARVLIFLGAFLPSKGISRTFQSV